ncbi:MAG: cell division protein FtsA [bacterium]
MSKNSAVIVALDVGTKKVTTLVAKVESGGKVQFVGKGVAKNENGIIAGNVVDMEATARAIYESITEAEKIADFHVKSLHIGLSGEHVSSMNSHGVVTVRGREVAQTDIDRVIEQARSVSLPSDRQIINVEIGEFTVDDQEGIRNPKGMAGKRLEVKVHILTSSSTMLRNLAKSVEVAGFQVEDVLVNGIAGGWAVLEEDEKQLGVALIDIGDGTTDISVYYKGNPVYTTVVPMGGRFVTTDISYAMRIPPVEAEKIKCRYGSARPDYVSNDEEIEVISIGTEEKKVKKVHFLASVLAPRVEEILMAAKKRLNDEMKESLIQTNIVLTGGTSELKDIESLAKDVFEQPVRVGKPKIGEDSSGFQDVLSSPSFSTAVGIVNYFAQRGKMKFKGKRGGFVGKIGDFLRKFFE